jgi:hypothetical protein
MQLVDFVFHIRYKLCFLACSKAVIVMISYSMWIAVSVLFMVIKGGQ